MSEKALLERAWRMRVFHPSHVNLWQYAEGEDGEKKIVCRKGKLMHRAPRKRTGSWLNKYYGLAWATRG